MRTNLLFIAILNVSFLFAQSGDDIANAIPIDGTSVSVNTLDYNSATASGLTPSCGATEDVFYKHDVSSGDNKITIGMASAAILVATNIEYQILRAINGDVNNLVEIACSSYDVVLLAGGSFEEVIEGISDTDDYYLRVYKPSGLGAALGDLLSGTTITMDSTFDETLSNTTIETEKPKIITKTNSLEVSNTTREFKSYTIYSVSGKAVSQSQQQFNMAQIDISALSSGFYILNLEGANGQRFLHKFVK